MGPVQKVLLGILLLSFFVFVAFFGRLPALRSTPIGFLHRCIWLHIPKTIRSVDHSLTGGRLSIYGASCSNYLFHKKNPIILILYLALLTSASTTFIYRTWSSISPFPHHILIPLLLPAPYIFTYLCATSTSSLITVAAHKAHRATYPFDYTLYYPRKICRTCRFEKPARSKHCSLCGTCVARADHHCAWVNNCIGATNYRWFLALLASLGSVLWYGTLLAYKVINNDVQATFSNPRNHKHRPAINYNANGGLRSNLLGLYNSIVQHFLLALQLDFSVTAIGLLAVLTAPLPCVLLLYHVYLAWAGMTTNETGKWADLRADATDGLLWKRPKTTQESLQSRNPRCRWPIVSDQVVVVTTTDPSLGDSESDEDDEKGQWEQCWSLGSLENLYDGGMRHNIRDALHLL